MRIANPKPAGIPPLRLIVAALCAAWVGLAAGCGRGERSQEAIHIGVFNEQGGVRDHAGVVTLRAASVLAAHFNERGGVAIGGRGYRVEISEIDAASGLARAVESTARLVDSGEVHFFVGPHDSDVAFRVMPVLEAAGAFVVHFSRDPAITAESGPLCVLGGPVPSQGFALLFRHFRQAGDVGTIAFISGDSDAALVEMATGDDLAELAGLEVRNPEVFDIRQRTYDGTVEAAVQERRVRRIVDLKPDLIVVAGVPDKDLPRLLALVRELGFGGPIASSRFHDTRILSRAGEAADGFVCLAAGPQAGGGNEFFEALKTAYTERFDHWDECAVASFYAVDALFRLIRAAGPAALEDPGLLEGVLDPFAWPDPFRIGGPALRIGGKAEFDRPCQIAIPFELVEFSGGVFRRLAAAEEVAGEEEG